MKKSDIYEVAIKILGLYMLNYLIDRSFSLSEVFNRVADVIDDRSSFLKSRVFLDLQNLLITILLICLFIFKTKWVVRRMCHAADYEEKAFLFAEKKIIYEISLVIVGLMQIVIALPEFSIAVNANLYRG